MRNLKEFPVTSQEVVDFLNEESERDLNSGRVGGISGTLLSYAKEFLENNKEFAEFLKSRQSFEPVEAKKKYNARLYILMRNDMDSLNAGKAVAQGSHAANAMVGYIRKYGTDYHREMLADWEKETNQDFGTCIVLASGLADIEDRVTNARIAGNVAGMLRDPTYPVQDGATCHLIDIDTCAYMFGHKEELAPYLENLYLMD